LLNVESNNFFVVLSFKVPFAGVASGGVIVNVVVVVRGSLCCYTFTNQQNGNGGAMKTETKWGYDIPWKRSSFKALYLFLSFSLSFSLA
jgi:hypothetical protein